MWPRFILSFLDVRTGITSGTSFLDLIDSPRLESETYAENTMAPAICELNAPCIFCLIAPPREISAAFFARGERARDDPSDGAMFTPRPGILCRNPGPQSALKLPSLGRRKRQNTLCGRRT